MYSMNTLRKPCRRFRHRSYSFDTISTSTSPLVEISEISSFDDLDLLENVYHVNLGQVELYAWSVRRKLTALNCTNCTYCGSKHSTRIQIMMTVLLRTWTTRLMTTCKKTWIKILYTCWSNFRLQINLHVVLYLRSVFQTDADLALLGRQFSNETNWGT